MERRLLSMCLYQRNKSGSAMLIVLLILSLLMGVNLVVSDRAYQNVLTLKDEQNITKAKILANKFIILNRQEKIKQFDDQKYGSVTLNNNKSLTIKVTNGKTVEVELNQDGY